MKLYTGMGPIIMVAGGDLEETHTQKYNCQLYANLFQCIPIQLKI